MTSDATETAAGSITVVADPANGPLPAEALQSLVARALPDVRLTTAKNLDGAGAGTVLVLTKNPAAAVAWRLAQSGPDKALQSWIGWAEALLARQRRDRKRILLVSDAILDRARGADRAALIRRLGGDATELPAEAPAAAPAGDPVRHVIAHALLAAPEAAEIAGEFAAATVAGDDMADLAATARAACAQQARSAEEMNLLRENIRLNLAANDRLLARPSQPGGRAGTDLDQGQHGSLATIASLERRLASSQNRVKDLMASRSWQVTAPMRAAGTLLRRVRRKMLTRA